MFALCVLVRTLFCFCQFDISWSHLGRQNLNWEDVHIRLVNSQVFRAFFKLMIDLRGLSPLWAVPCLGKWSWVVLLKSSLSKPWGTSWLAMFFRGLCLNFCLQFLPWVSALPSFRARLSTERRNKPLPSWVATSYVIITAVANRLEHCY